MHAAAVQASLPGCSASSGLHTILFYCPRLLLLFATHLLHLQVRQYAAELVCVLSHLHENGIVYVDLKPENVLVQVRQASITTF